MKLLIKTWGCQMNVYDSDRMAESMAAMGFTTTDLVDEADMVILNTCHIREKATEKVFSELGRLRNAKSARNGRMLIAVGGCVAQAEGEEIVRRAPYVDMVFGPQTYHRLPEMVALARRRTGQPIIDTEFPADSKFDQLPEEAAAGRIGPSAFLAIQEGCDKFCTFCVVPYTRGAEFSRPSAHIIAEATHQVARGAVEITLLGQNVNAYHGDGPDGRTWSLEKLVRRLAEIDGLHRIRYTTSHPMDMDDGLVRAHRDVPALMPYLHLPVQSGSDRVLAAMNRRHTVRDYLDTVDRLRAARPDIALSSDFIVGFPGETDEDFDNTLRLVQAVGFAQAYSFKYSARPGTPAAGMDGRQVDDTVKTDRLTALQQLLNDQQREFNSDTVGRTVPVLFDRIGRKDRGERQILGRTPYMQVVHVPADDRYFGTVADVRIMAGHANSLAGEIAPASRRADADARPRPRHADTSSA